MPDDSNVLPFTGETRLPVPPRNVLEGGLEADLENVFLVGRKQDGELYLASSDTDAGEILLLLELAKAEVLRRV